MKVWHCKTSKTTYTVQARTAWEAMQRCLHTWGQNLKIISVLPA